MDRRTDYDQAHSREMGRINDPSFNLADDVQDAVSDIFRNDDERKAKEDAREGKYDPPKK
jgi:hypothetical protein